VRWEDLKRFGVVMKRAGFFVSVPDHRSSLLEKSPTLVRERLVERPAAAASQLDLFARAA
jgi:predicted DNA-binding helix-hairpin-helix protein